MITEDYCSYEIDKLLKEKGFDEECYTFYEYGSKKFYREESIPCRNSRSDDYAAPTHQMAMKWLRKKGVLIEIHCQYFEEWYAVISIKNPLDIRQHLTKNYPKFEQAVDAAIKFSLENLI